MMVIDDGDGCYCHSVVDCCLLFSSVNLLLMLMSDVLVVCRTCIFRHTYNVCSAVTLLHRRRNGHGYAYGTTISRRLVFRRNVCPFPRCYCT